MDVVKNKLSTCGPDRGQLLWVRVCTINKLSASGGMYLRLF